MKKGHVSASAKVPYLHRKFASKPEAILVTLPERFFGEYPGGELQARKILEGMNKTDSYHWMQTCGSGLPTIDVAFCYLVFKGKVQYRFNIKGYERNQSGSWNDGGLERIYQGKNLVLLEGPVILPPRDYPMKGFQGFRYTELLF